MKTVYMLELVPATGPTNIIAFATTPERAKVAAWERCPALVGDQWHGMPGHEVTQRRPGGDRLRISRFDVLE